MEYNMKVSYWNVRDAKGRFVKRKSALRRSQRAAAARKTLRR